MPAMPVMPAVVRRTGVLALLIALLGLVAPTAAHANATEADVANRLNGARADAGLPALVQTADLVAVARQQAQRMAASGSLHHNPNLATDVAHWVNVGENVGYAGSASSLHSALMNSAGHRANILSTSYRQVGVGAVWSGSRLWVAQVFRNPDAVAAAYPAVGAAPPPAPAPAPPPPPGSELFVVLPHSTGSGQLEVHGMSQGSGFRDFSVHAATAFGAQNPSQWHFSMGSYGGSGRPDLIGVKHSGTASGKVEVHVLTAASGYRTFALHAATPLPVVNAAQFQFATGPVDGDGRSNLYAIFMNGTGSGKTEVHVLGEASGYSRWLSHSATSLGQTRSSEWTFLVGDAGGRGDLVGVLRTGTASGRTEVHSLSRSSGYTAFSLHAATAMQQTPETAWKFVLSEFDRDGRPDLIGVLAVGASGKTEAHVLSGGSSFTSFGAHLATGLAPQPSSSRFGAR
jgi:hypothetical protein